ncbi:MAG: type VI secretion system baseplate subunit TssG, partial [Pseudomonadota bacterium]
FGINAEVEQFVGAALPVRAEEQSRLGSAFASLGSDAMIGAQAVSVDTKFRLRLFPETLENYEKFLPGGEWSEQLVDTILNAVGFEYEWDVELVLPDHQPRPVSLGEYGNLGWTSWMRKPVEETQGQVVRTRFTPMNDEVVQMMN